MHNCYKEEHEQVSQRGMAQGIDTNHGNSKDLSLSWFTNSHTFAFKI